MTEYWQSQSRKYCDFCKCWYADNKVSISFHENGKKHKENLQKHISQLGKKSAKEFKQKEKMEDDIKKMEEAAMAAYLKDVQNNADLTSKYINETLEQSGASSKDLTVDKPAKATPIWHEVKNDDGSFYFWNTVTNETTWEPPDEYLSVSQVQEQKNRKKGEKTNKKQTKEKDKDYSKEVKAHASREKLNERPMKKTEPAPAMTFGPITQPAKPYGTWISIPKEPEEKIDYQLPKTDKVIIAPPVEVPPEPEIEFKERTIESLVDEPVEFKKRKVSHVKRNVRQRLNDD